MQQQVSPSENRKSASRQKSIKKTCYTANIVYLFVHVLYFVLFLVTQTWVPFFVNIGSIVCYILFFLVLRKEKFYLYALLCGNHFFAFVTVCTIYMGFGSGFCLYLISLCVVSFITTYFSYKGIGMKGSIIWVGLSAALYLGLYISSRFTSPVYAIPQWLEIFLFSFHSAAAFLFVAAYLVFFVNYAKRLEKRIMGESRTDELTQVNNRYALYDFFDSVENKTDYYLALFDIDDFKLINDKYGHVSGDHVLQQVAKIADGLFADAFFCRYGGEEFVIIDNKPSSLDEFKQQLETLRKAVSDLEFEFDGDKVHLTITIGVSKFEEGFSNEEWINFADKKMYQGKSSGKNVTVI